MTQETTPDLAACPFCGGTDVETFGPYSWYRLWGISHSCRSFYNGAQELAQGFHTEAEAIAAWNQRTNPTDCCEVERLRNLLALADDTLMESIGAFPLQGHPLRAACLAIRSETGDDYQERKRRAAAALRAKGGTDAG